MSSAYSTQYYATSGAMPMAVPSKEHYGDYYATGHTSYSVSPPESEVVSSSGSDVASYSNSGYSSYSGYSGYSAAASYAGSTHGDYDSSPSVNGVDFNEYVQGRFDEFHELHNPVALDKNLAVQAQTSGKLNAKQRQLLELQKKTQARLSKVRSRFNEGMADAREVHADLQSMHQTVTSLQSKASKKHPKEYRKARERYPSPDY